MRVVVSSEGPGLDSALSANFGRCPMYLMVDTETMATEEFPNPAQNAPGGAGIQAAQFVVSKGAQAVLTGNVGPKAGDVLAAAGVSVYLSLSKTVAQAVEELIAGQLQGASAHPAAGPREQEIASLAREVADLRKRLASIMTRIEAMTKEG